MPVPDLTPSQQLQDRIEKLAQRFRQRAVVRLPRVRDFHEPVELLKEGDEDG